MYDSPSSVVRAVAENFSIEITPQQVEVYDLDKRNGKALSKPLADLYKDTRDRFIRDVELMPMAQKSMRLRKLHQLLERNEGKAEKIVATAIDLARKEMLELELGEGVGGVLIVHNAPAIADPSSGESVQSIAEDQANATVSDTSSSPGP